eukprot:3786215-Prymnesium_polylepis.1
MDAASCAPNGDAIAAQQAAAQQRLVGRCCHGPALRRHEQPRLGEGQQLAALTDDEAPDAPAAELTRLR